MKSSNMKTILLFALFLGNIANLTYSQCYTLTTDTGSSAINEYVEGGSYDDGGTWSTFEHISAYSGRRDYDVRTTISNRPVSSPPKAVSKLLEAYVQQQRTAGEGCSSQYPCLYVHYCTTHQFSITAYAINQYYYTSGNIGYTAMGSAMYDVPGTGSLYENSVDYGQHQAETTATFPPNKFQYKYNSGSWTDTSNNYYSGSDQGEEDGRYQSFTAGTTAPVSYTSGELYAYSYSVGYQTVYARSYGTIIAESNVKNIGQSCP